MTHPDLLQIVQFFLGKSEKSADYFKLLEREIKVGVTFFLGRNNGTGFACLATDIPWLKGEYKVLAMNQPMGVWDRA